MTQTEAPSRNEPCHCGSGKKYKVCCEGAAPPAGARWNSPYVLVLIVLLVAGSAYLVGRSRVAPTPPRTMTEAAATSPVPPAASPVIPFDAAIPVPMEIDPSAAAAALPTAAVPQPPGPVPEGKVWSPEHGHWHDMPGATPQMTPIDATASGSPLPATPTPQPPGPVPAGKVWSPEHGHWHDVPPAGATPTQP